MAHLITSAPNASSSSTPLPPRPSSLFRCQIFPQIFLILRINVRLGIPDIFFAIGDEAMVALMEGLHAMPVVIMFVMLCPEGAEGTTFALLTTLSTMAGTVASDLGSWCTEIWDVSNTR